MLSQTILIFEINLPISKNQSIKYRQYLQENICEAALINDIHLKNSITKKEIKYREVESQEEYNYIKEEEPKYYK